MVADVLVDFEMSEVRPLFLDAFILMDRQLHWQDEGELDDDS